MSTWNNQPVWMQTKENGKKIKCQICGNTPDAIWSGEEITAICFHCAFEVLPKLMADAASNGLLNHPVPHYLQISAFQTMWKEAEKNFWYAIACQLLQTIKKEDATHDTN